MGWCLCYRCTDNGNDNGACAGMVCVMIISRRERMALRADKWWASVWLKQMCMDQKIVRQPKDGVLVYKQNKVETVDADH